MSAHKEDWSVMIGKTYGRWTVLAINEQRRPGGKCYLDCRCACGSQRAVSATRIRIKKSLSCGCLGYEKLRAASVTHGMTHTTIYAAWCRMIRRCSDMSRPSYGGRGITVCKRWQSFENFFADMGELPQGLTLERKDNDGPYSPDNCKWATPTEQGRNKRNNTLLTIDGETRCLAAWAEKSGIHRKTIGNRLRKGWPQKAAVYTPLLRPRVAL